MKTHFTASVQETEALAEAFARELLPGDVIAFRGGMGAGKTAFVRGLAKGLGCEGEVSSPTFALVHEYAGKLPLYHFDMYRVHTLEDLYSTGFFDYLEQGGVLAVEWSENIASALEGGTIFVTMEPVISESPMKADEENTRRKITIEGENRL